MSRRWFYCSTHDVRFLDRSPATLEHVTGREWPDGSFCDVSATGEVKE